jgi:hypothetical protein
VVEKVTVEDEVAEVRGTEEAELAAASVDARTVSWTMERKVG